MIIGILRVKKNYGEKSLLSLGVFISAMLLLPFKQPLQQSDYYNFHYYLFLKMSPSTENFPLPSTKTGRQSAR